MTSIHVSMRGGNKELTEALEQIDIETWLDREGVTYRRTRGSSGAQLNVKECPVCGGSNWKVYLNADTGLGNCFSGDCEKHFNKWSFIAATLGVDNRAVVAHIKAVAAEQGWRATRKKTIAVETARAELHLPESIQLPFNGRNLRYLDNRNITGDIASYFELRFSHHGTFSYIDEEGNPRQQDYSNRVLIPIYDLEGELVSFQGRDTTGTAEKKYLFPPGFSSTGTHLYNGYNAIGAETIVIGEGVFDVAAIKIALDEDMSLRDVVAVGSFGKHLSHGDANSQTGKLMALREHGLKNIVFMWDRETKATAAAVEAGLRLVALGFVVRIALLPPGLDPNETTTQIVREAFYKAITLNARSATLLLLQKR